jgi:hypothetical protein
MEITFSHAHRAADAQHGHFPQQFVSAGSRHAEPCGNVVGCQVLPGLAHIGVLRDWRAQGPDSGRSAPLFQTPMRALAH